MIGEFFQLRQSYLTMTFYPRNATPGGVWAVQKYPGQAVRFESTQRILNCV